MSADDLAVITHEIKRQFRDLIRTDEPPDRVTFVRLVNTVGISCDHGGKGCPGGDAVYDDAVMSKALAECPRPFDDSLLRRTVG